MGYKFPAGKLFGLSKKSWWIAPLKRLPNPWTKVFDSGTYQTTISCFALPSVQNHWALVKRLSSLLPLKSLMARCNGDFHSNQPGMLQSVSKSIVNLCLRNSSMWVQCLPMIFEQKMGFTCNAKNDEFRLAISLRFHECSEKTKEFSSKPARSQKRNYLTTPCKRAKKTQRSYKNYTEHRQNQLCLSGSNDPLLSLSWRKHWKQKWYPNGQL